MNSLDQEKLPVRLKGVGDGLWVTLDPTLPIDALEQELKRIFERLKHLAVNARVVLDPGEKSGHEDLIKTLGLFLKDKFNVGLVSEPPKKPSARQTRIRQRELKNGWQQHRSDVLMMTGRIRAGQKITARKHFILMGDVNPGGEIVAGGDILVMGCLRGTAAAGQPQSEEAIVFALDFRPTQVQIGGFVAAGLSSSTNQRAEYAHVENNSIVVDDYLKTNSFGKQPWPEIR